MSDEATIQMFREMRDAMEKNPGAVIGAWPLGEKLVGLIEEGLMVVPMPVADSLTPAATRWIGERARNIAAAILGEFDVEPRRIK